MRTATLHDYKQRMLRVLGHIDRHLGDALPLDELARIACFSPYHFHRVFHGMMGESVKEYVRRLRLERSASRLKFGSATIIDIALEAGYDSHEAFTRSFKATFGAAPSQFRLANHQRAALAPSGIHYGQPVTIRFRTLRKGGTMKVEIRQLKPVRVAFIRHTGPYSEVGQAWDRLLTFMGKEGYLAGNPMMLGIVHDDPEVTPPDKVRYDACLAVDDSFSPTGDIGVQTIAGGEYAVTTHKGPYNQVGKTYSEFLGQWLPRSGHELRNLPCFEVYVNDPQSTPPDELLTDIFAPVQAAVLAAKD
ncbi:AraC family transcriptional regulator [Occallatibacter riparius]|uniref:AraC family transcriptional regulator n=1 Tax=Occallatibacter riparius TaxID=1002689 RepID=A0A9J7BJ73_9BACT|nr:AraC family transcriptional regulator [Occallatibacter riparius]UWZ82964.1 AraC family transcriptional regulator [Occallatibacter riparius]